MTRTLKAHEVYVKTDQRSGQRAYLDANNLSGKSFAGMKSLAHPHAAGGCGRDRLQGRPGKCVAMIALAEVSEGVVELLVTNGLLKEHEKCDRQVVGARRHRRGAQVEARSYYHLEQERN